MPKFVNQTVEIVASGLELTAVFVVGAAPIAPLFKLGWLIMGLAFSAIRSILKRNSN